MKISLQESMKKSINRDLDFEFTPDNFIMGTEEVVFKKPVKVKGKVKVLSGIVDLDVIVETELEMTCDRCLIRYDKDVNLKIKEKLAREVSEDDFDTIQLNESDTVDLAEIITRDIISSLPIQSLCSENCKGLCQECGTNLNQRTCDCDKDQVDIRLEALKDLFKEV